MRKVVINLSPQKYKTPSLNIKKITAYLPLVAIGAVIGLGLIFLLQLVAMKKAYTHASKAKAWRQWEEKAKILQELKGQIAQLETERDKLNKALTPSYQMSKVLGDIFSSLPKNIWFQNFGLKEEVLEIQGYVVKWNQDYLQSLDSFINALREKEYFSSSFSILEIKESQKVDFNGVECLKFIIQCKK